MAMKGLSWSVFAPLVARVKMSERVGVRSLWPSSLPTVFSRTKKSKSKPMTKSKFKMIKKRSVAFLKVIDSERKILEKRAKTSGLVLEVPDCHFLVVDKPHGMLAGTLTEEVERGLRITMAAAVNFRYLNARYEYEKFNWWKLGHENTKRRKITLQHMRGLRRVRFMQLRGLDSFTSGVVPFALEGAIELMDQFEIGTREFEFTAEFGKATDSFYSSGQVTAEKDFEHITEEMVDQVVRDQFIGELHQVPPMFSNVKLNRRPLWLYARKGKTAAELGVKARPIEVFSLKVLKFELPRIWFHIECCRSTYVQVLVNDLGLALGSYANVTKLRRTRTGPFHVSDAIAGDKRTLRKLRPDIGSYCKHANSVIPGSYIPPAPVVEVKKKKPKIRIVVPDRQYERRYFYLKPQGDDDAQKSAFIDDHEFAPKNAQDSSTDTLDADGEDATVEEEYEPELDSESDAESESELHDEHDRVKETPQFVDEEVQISRQQEGERGSND
ncbi:tRNA pseudouridine synthase B [Porphyridium purpureum]|uniref:tRNA pseudouridine(55) synthase n=1 Tax=Porphyridium purpureum TaxID=35688 RepID=A0A5J4YKJ4_PORPP|nr:tRNA pseudouridine synthase B [Porphyridium purpureum]|eukprot:POR0232..scf244_11